MKKRSLHRAYKYYVSRGKRKYILMNEQDSFPVVINFASERVFRFYGRRYGHCKIYEERKRVTIKIMHFSYRTNACHAVATFSHREGRNIFCFSFLSVTDLSLKCVPLRTLNAKWKMLIKRDIPSPSDAISVAPWSPF